MSKAKPTAVVKNGKLHCTICKGEFDLKLSKPVDVVVEQMKAFNELHKYCKS